MIWIAPHYRVYLEMVRQVVEEDHSMKTIEYYMDLPYKLEIVLDLYAGGSEPRNQAPAADA